MKRRVRVAIVGNPNVGKTAIMNALAGTNEKIGNWPGVTVKKKVGKYNFRGVDVELIDLPGIYSLTSYTLEEKVARSFLLEGEYDVVMDVIDVTLLGRNLYLTLELLEMGIKPVLVLNKADELEKFSVEVGALAEILKLPVVSVSALRREGLEELSETLLRVATGGIKPEGIVPTYSEDLENAVTLLSMKVKKELKGKTLPYTLRWFTLKLLEKDPEITEEAREQLKLSQSLFKEIDRIEGFIKEKYRCDLPSFIARERFNLASQIARKVVKGRQETKKSKTLSDRIDLFVTHPVSGIPLFFVIMWLVFKLTFDLSAPISDFIDSVFGTLLPNLVEDKLTFLPSFLRSLIKDGILAGVGAVMVFLPVLGILYFLMSALEDSGYMARAAALWDNFMKLFGLSGASVIPMILGFGCNVPAVYATRAMHSSHQKLITMMIIPWMSCSARLPVYAVFVAAFFKEKESLVILSLYLVGIILALSLSYLLSKLTKLGTEEEFFIELPSYKLPAWSVVINQTWIEVREFVYKAGTVIFSVSVFIWALASLPAGVEYAGENSIVGHVGRLLLPIFEPLGVNDWKPVVALIFGALAKEVVVGTLGTLYGTEENVTEALSHVFTPSSALAFMVFTLLYTPCVATIAAIKQESGTWKYPLIVVAVELTTAWIIAFGVYRIANILLC